VSPWFKGIGVDPATISFSCRDFTEDPKKHPVQRDDRGYHTPEECLLAWEIEGQKFHAVISRTNRQYAFQKYCRPTFDVYLNGFDEPVRNMADIGKAFRSRTLKNRS